MRVLTNHNPLNASRFIYTIWVNARARWEKENDGFLQKILLEGQLFLHTLQVF